MKSNNANGAANISLDASLSNDNLKDLSMKAFVNPFEGPKVSLTGNDVDNLYQRSATDLVDVSFPHLVGSEFNLMRKPWLTRLAWLTMLFLSKPS